ncbi:MAG TPA: hypothetical protein VI603_07415 [Saprospiraceae bacterium]|nr:hypothetical protein [Saprospiraceae bacterium]
MKVNKILREQILQIIDNQIRQNDPAETRITHDRLTQMGFSDVETKQLIGQCVMVELFEVMKYLKPFNEARYIKNLRNLPNEPSE